MDPIIVFCIAGVFAMSAALCASQLVKMDDETAPVWARGKSGKTKVLLGGNLFAVILIAAMAYGIFHLIWWIPVVCLFISFPVIHVLILEKLLGPSKGFMISGFAALASTALMWLYW